MGKKEGTEIYHHFLLAKMLDNGFLPCKSSVYHLKSQQERSADEIDQR